MNSCVFRWGHCGWRASGTSGPAHLRRAVSSYPVSDRPYHGQGSENRLVRTASIPHNWYGNREYLAGHARCFAAARPAAFGLPVSAAYCDIGSGRCGHRKGRVHAGFPDALPKASEVRAYPYIHHAAVPMVLAAALYFGNRAVGAWGTRCRPCSAPYMPLCWSDRAAEHTAKRCCRTRRTGCSGTGLYPH